MRILFLSNNYPPVSNGGYEQLCQEVAVAFTRMEHRVSILTSADGPGAAIVEEAGIQVRRQLHLEVEGGVLPTTVRLLRDRNRQERENLNSLRTAIDDMHPDAALIWGMWNVPRSVPALTERLMPGRVVYYMCDYWPSLPSAYVQQFQEPARRKLAAWPKKLLGQLMLTKLAREQAIPLALERPFCVSQAVKTLLLRSGVPIGHAQLIYNGIEVGQFPPVRIARWQQGEARLNLLYAGRLALEKGVRTAIQALALLGGRPGARVTLDIVGTGGPHYLQGLKDLVQELRLDEKVTFRDAVPRHEVPALLAEHDVLVFPSEWDALPRVVMEAMATGTVVIGTTTGGTGELLEDGVTGLTFPPGDATGLASQIQRVLEDRPLGERLARAARRRVEQQFTFQRMVDELERVLRDL